MKLQSIRKIAVRKDLPILWFKNSCIMVFFAARIYIPPNRALSLYMSSEKIIYNRIIYNRIFSN